jgi:hypothetical protein
LNCDRNVLVIFILFKIAFHVEIGPHVLHTT